MKIPRPKSLNGLILVGFGLVALPLLFAIVWALLNLDRLAAQSERLVVTGVSVAQQNRRLTEQVSSLYRLSRQYAALQDPELLLLMRQDLGTIESTLDGMVPLAEEAGAIPLARSIRVSLRHIVATLREGTEQTSGEGVSEEEFDDVRRRVGELTSVLNEQIDGELTMLLASTQRAQQIAAWQTVALIPGTVVLILFFTVLVAKPIRQIDRAINQLGQSGFSKPVIIKGPTDLERLGRQLDWLRLRLLELAQEKNRFLRHMSHELKTPLANIREGTELLLDGAVGELNNDQSEVTDILRTNGLKLQQLIENLLSFSAWQAKSEILTLSDFPIRALIISVAKAQRLALKAALIQLKLEVADIVVNADRDKLRTVLDNLLSNAIKFTPRGGTIAIRVKSTPNSFVLEFADTGPGIPEDERPRIFEAFFQGQQEQGGHLAGTGIGLSVVLECIQAHDGAVELVDSAEFSGAHFRIHIPQQRVDTAQRMAANA